jgi:hypothetical protein
VSSPRAQPTILDDGHISLVSNRCYTKKPQSITFEVVYQYYPSCDLEAEWHIAYSISLSHRVTGYLLDTDRYIGNDKPYRNLVLTFQRQVLHWSIPLGRNSWLFHDNVVMCRFSVSPLARCCVKCFCRSWICRSRYSGEIFSFSDTIATLSGILTPLVVGSLTTNVSSLLAIFLHSFYQDSKVNHCPFRRWHHNGITTCHLTNVEMTFQMYSQAYSH